MKTTLFFLFSCLFSSFCFADATTFRIALKKMLNQDDWHVEYVFSKPIKRIHFNGIDATFIDENDVRVGDGMTHIDNGTYQFKKPVTQFSLRVSQNRKDVMGRFDTPFIPLNEQGGYAFYLGNLVPNKASNGQTHTVLSDKNVQLTMRNTNNALLFDGVVSTKRYQLTRSVKQIEEDLFTLVVSDSAHERLVNWTLTDLNKLLPQFSQSQKKPLGFKPTVILNQQYHPEHFGSEGSVKGHFLIMNVYSDGSANNDFYRYGVLPTLAHEVSHLWNATKVTPAPASAPWVFEGMSEWMASQAMLALALRPAEHHRKFITHTYQKCENALNSAEIHPYDADFIYACGFVFYHQISQQVDAGLMAQLHAYLAQQSDGYREKDIYQFAAQQGINKAKANHLQQMMKADNTSAQAFSLLANKVQ